MPSVLELAACRPGWGSLSLSLCLLAAPEPLSVAADGGEGHWAFRPLGNPPVPTVADAAWPESPVDRFVLARLEADGLAPAADADRATLVRRLSFTLVGLPPTPGQVDAFVAGGDLPALVDELLASPRFGEKWARHWLDLARYAETNGRDRNVVLSHAWRYRDWVIGAFNRDLPYDRFVREQVAGDLLEGGGDSARIATGFLTLGPKSFQEAEPDKFALDLVDEQIDTLSRSLLGLTIACARCHDHKFDPIPTADYYALAGIFLSTESLYGPGPLYFERQTYNRPVAVLGRPESDPLDAGVLKWREEIYALNQKAMSLRSAAYRIKRTITGTLRDRGLKQAADDPALAAEDARAEAWYAEAKAALETRNRLIAAPPPSPDYAMALRDQPAPADCRIRARGEFNQPGEVVPRGGLSLPGLPPMGTVAAAESGRRQLADWLASPDHPLTARVMVNRVWHHLFGRGLVRTVDNFGLTGEAPSHPELLDHLAWTFIHEDGWSVKRLIRRLVLSRTWGLASGVSPDDPRHRADPGNALLWRAPFRRLDVEAFRDATLMVAGHLEIGPPEGGSMLAGTFLGKEYGIGDIHVSLGPEIAADRRRTVYLPIVRNELAEVLGLFDFADPNAASGARNARTIPSQALFLMNGDFVEAQSRAAAARFAGRPDEAAALDGAARLTQGRPLSADLRSALQAYLDERRSEEIGRGQTPEAAALDAWTDVFQVLFSSVGFRYLN